MHDIQPLANYMQTHPRESEHVCFRGPVASYLHVGGPVRAIQNTGKSIFH